MAATGEGPTLMPEPIDPKRLAGDWLHSHEESRGGQIVLRPATYKFPPARGRRGLSLKPDGVVNARSPGADDRNVRSAGSWDLKGSSLTLEAPGWSGVYEVKSVDDQALV